MADTIITTPATTNESSSAGWIVAVIILLLLIAGVAYAWMHMGSTAAAPTGGSANINVTLPSGSAAPVGGTAAGGDVGPAPEGPAAN
jgi:cell division protein YceG involved in septum cleavage